MAGDLTVQPRGDVPPVPASAGALIFDPGGRLLIVKTIRKNRWSLPGGRLERGNESPWEACRREAFEECSLRLERGRLVCVDFLRPRNERLGGLRFLFDCGTLPDEQLAAISLQPEEIEQHRLVPPREAIGLLNGPVARRVAASIDAERCVYLENGHSVPGVR